MQRRSLFFYLTTITLVLFTFVSGYYFDKNQELERDVVAQAAESAAHQLAYSQREYQKARSQFISIVELLSHNRSLYEFVVKPSFENKTFVEEVWSSVAYNQKWYTQIRFLSQQGVEQIQLDYVDGKAIAADNERLQDQSHKDYFEFAQTLSKNEIGVWGVGFDNDYAEKTNTPQPNLRLITPVYVADSRAGYLVLTVDVEYLSSRLNFSSDERFAPEVVGQKGFYLSDIESDQADAQVDTELSFSRGFPNTWQMMQHDSSGYLNENNHLVIFNKVFLAPNQPLYLVIELGKQQIDELARKERESLMQEASLVLVLMLAFAIPATLLVSHLRKRSVESKLARAALSGMSALIISERNHQAIMVNDQFCELTGLTRNEVLSTNIIKNLLGDEQIERSLKIFEHVSQHQLWEGEITIPKMGEPKPVTALLRVQSVLESSGRVSYYISSIVDISDRKALEEQLRILSERDELTQLWNRRKFELELTRQSTLIERYPTAPNACLALLDIDYFKRINDELGHDEGDKVIASVAKMLESVLRETDFVARIGGEEFAIIMPHTSLVEAQLALERLRTAIEVDATLPITVSIGVTNFMSDSARCYKCADIALYESKSSGRNRVSTFTDAHKAA